MQAATQKKSSFLSHVNGMRAIAILGILFYHLNSDYCPTGYFGVDVFLVISGYLLLASLMKAQRAGEIHYGSFLLKKSWRIIPSWLLVSLVFCFGSAWFMIPSDRVEICSTASRSAFFAADFYIDHLYDYFNQNAHKNLFLHYWYLSITCQMYLLIPLLLMLLLRFFSRKTIAILLGVLALLSLVFYVLTTSVMVPLEFRRALLSGTGMTSAYYHLLPRLWEILGGGIVLLLPAWQDKRALRMVLETLALVAMVLSFFVFETGSSQVYVAALAAVLFVRYGGEGWGARLLSWRPIQWVGTISFSLYLWHWPIMAGWKYARLGEITWYDELGMVLLSFLLASLAWRFIERLKMPQAATRPARSARFIPALLLVLFAIGIGPYYREIRDEARNLFRGQGMVIEMHQLIDARPRDAALTKGFSSKNFERLPAYIGTKADATPSFILIGDSHAIHSFHGMDSYCTEHGIRGVTFNNGVVPLWWCYRENSSPWDEARAEDMMEYLRQNPHIEYVFIIILWQKRLYGKTAEVMDGDTFDWRHMKSLNSEQQIALREAGLRETCRRLREMGRRVVLLGDVPLLPEKLSPYEHWLKVKMLRGVDETEYLTPVWKHQQMEGPARQLLQGLVQEGVAWAYIDSAEPLRQGDNYRTRNDAGQFLYSDNSHITFAGSELVGRYIMSEWERLKREQPATPNTPEPPKEPTEAAEQGSQSPAPAL